MSKSVELTLADKIEQLLDEVKAEEYGIRSKSETLKEILELLAQERAKADIAGRIAEASLPMHRYGLKYGNMPKRLANEIAPFAMKRIAELKAEELESNG